MTFSQKLRENFRCGKCTIVQRVDKKFIIFSTLGQEEFLRLTGWHRTVEEAKKNIGYTSGVLDETINTEAKEDSWRIIGTIDFSELGGEGYKEGEKVRILPDAKEKCLKLNVDSDDTQEEMIKDGFGFVSRREGLDYCIDNKDKSDWSWFPPSVLEPYLEDEVDEIKKAIETLEKAGKIKEGKIII